MRCFGGIPSCEKCWIQVSPVPASDEVCPPVCARIPECSCVSSINLKENCIPPVRWTNVPPLSEVSGRGSEQNNLFKIVEGKEINVNRSCDCDVKMKVGVCEGRVKTVAMGAQRVIIPDNIGNGSFEYKGDKGVANPE
ncbi:hypothetical protein TNCV_782171 [Trichonephila clavipes]|nr:hypothetical protein TNCV_782171 [Trichonephila clavipes]